MQVAQQLPPSIICFPSVKYTPAGEIATKFLSILTTWTHTSVINGGEMPFQNVTFPGVISATEENFTAKKK